MPDIPGDPGGASDQTVYQVVLRNAGRSECSLRGWPGLAVRGPTGRLVRSTITDVRFNDLGAVPDTPTVLRPGGRAVVTLTTPFRVSGCLSRWSLTLRVPGAARPVTVTRSEPGSVLCAGGMQLSPVYPLRVLQSAISGLNGPSAIGFRLAPVIEPPLCRAASLRTDVAYSAAQPSGSIVVLRVSSATACTIRSGGWPTVRLNLAGGGSPIGKVYSYQPAWGTAGSPYRTYVAHRRQVTAVPLAPGGSVWVAVIAASQGVCHQVESATVYPTAIGLGPGATAALPQPASLCGRPRVLPFLPGGPQARARSLARQALTAFIAATSRPAPAGVRNSTALPAHGDQPAGFWYGSDGPLLMACGSPPYRIKGSSGDCSTTNGNYGGYLGEIGKWDRWQGCDRGGLAWNTADFNDANLDKTGYGRGVGAAAYWMMAGPGRDADPASQATAWAWGQAQAQRAASDLSSSTLVMGYVFMDIERDTYHHEFLNGWNEAWPSTCATSGYSSFIPAAADRADVNGFWDYIRHDTPWLPGVYSSGPCCGSVNYEWDGIFTASETLSNTAEWTFNAETPSLATFPSGFAWPVSADWFASAPARCDYVWQWTGGTTPNGITNFRVDQVDGNSVNGRFCA